MKAGSVNAKATELARSLIKPGASLIEIATKVEACIKENGVGLSFPVNISINNCAAHYSPPIDDASILPDEGIVKIDVGGHVDGYISDHAISVDIDNSGGKIRKLIDTSERALEAAIKQFKPGNDVLQVGAVIEKTIKNAGFLPIRNLGGHSLEQFVLHSGTFVPNVGSGQSYIIKEGDAFAIEPFATDGAGFVVDGPEWYIFRFKKRPKRQVSFQLKMMIEKIRKNYNNLPFSPRWLHGITKKATIDGAIKKLISLDVLEGYKILMEHKGGKVSQAEHTVIVNESNAEITTKIA
ncbi:type II methionyl aminopeptidase [Candidatus Bathyarchaeota archaeon]|nr:type II methionyl aminopeptidase [Candidatus Bathyarchaeota archaeon]